VRPRTYVALGFRDRKKGDEFPRHARELEISGERDNNIFY
jgi:hypothetical protein